MKVRRRDHRLWQIWTRDEKIRSLWSWLNAMAAQMVLEPSAAAPPPGARHSQAIMPFDTNATILLMAPGGLPEC
jgi:hypothetical protein